MGNIRGKKSVYLLSKWLIMLVPKGRKRANVFSNEKIWEVILLLVKKVLLNNRMFLRCRWKTVAWDSLQWHIQGLLLASILIWAPKLSVQKKVYDRSYYCVLLLIYQLLIRENVSFRWNNRLKNAVPKLTPE